MQARHLIPVLAVAAIAGCSSTPEQPPLPEPVENARATYAFAREAFDTGRYRDAIAGFQRAEQHFISIDDARGVAVTAISRAETQLLLDEDAAAEDSLQTAEAALARISNRELDDRAQLLAARLAMEREPARAEDLLAGLQGTALAAQARLLLCEMEIRRDETRCAMALSGEGNGNVLHLQARAAMRDREQETAALLLQRALDAYRARAFRPGIASVHASLAELAEQSGDRAAAVEHLERALYLRLWIRDRVHAATLVDRLAKLESDSKVLERYSRWHDALGNDTAEPGWDAMLEEMLSPG